MLVVKRLLNDAHTNQTLILLVAPSRSRLHPCCAASTGAGSYDCRGQLVLDVSFLRLIAERSAAASDPIRIERSFEDSLSESSLPEIGCSQSSLDSCFR